MSERLSFEDFKLIADHVEMLLPEDDYEAAAALGAVFNRRVAQLLLPDEQRRLIDHFKAAIELIMDRLYPPSGEGV